ncbi:ribosome assembly cofactor RimP [Sediminibacterium salmoneum]|uniref:ribosome assembly cofactor RimP n=1 Tax=Sediminibacterium salmoneum TaxID=426421 RepID=UPI00047DE959|nr:ribosome assembly cofactor RimP [Sediminibacterium salmoneum]
MATDKNIAQIEAFLQTLLEEEPGYFLVSIKVKPTDNIKVFLDGDNGLPIEKCVFFNRKLYHMIEEAGLYEEGAFSLEVSSPGIDEPLKLKRQYQKNIGRTIQVVFNDNTIKEGILETVAEADIMLQCTSGKGKKAVTEQVLIPFENIKSTTVQIKF